MKCLGAPRPMFSRVGLVTLVVAVATGCGGSPRVADEATGRTTTSLGTDAEQDPAAIRTSTSSPGRGFSGDEHTARGDSRADANDGGAEPDAPSTTEQKITVHAEVEHECLRPGTSQVLKVRTDRDTDVAYDTIYADGTSGMSEDHYGGSNVGKTDATGTWSDTWVVSPDAPPGEAEINVIAVGPNGQGFTRLTFEVAELTGHCG